jgi:hypothetical protein
MKILLEDFNVKVGREDFLNGQLGMKVYTKISNDNGIGVVNFTTSKNLTVKCTMFPHCNNHKYTWMSPDGKTHN